MEYSKLAVENLLVINESFKKDDFYKEKVRVDKYGAESIIRELDKKKLCKFICDDISKIEQKAILINLKKEIDMLIK